MNADLSPRNGYCSTFNRANPGTGLSLRGTITLAAGTPWETRAVNL